MIFNALLIIGLLVSAMTNQEMSRIYVKNRQNGGQSSQNTLRMTRTYFIFVVINNQLSPS